MEADNEATYRIPLHNAQKEIVEWALCDANLYHQLNQIKWHLGHGGYAHGFSPLCKRTMSMHHRVWQLLGNDAITHGFVIDHVNNNRIDNRRSNLRIVSYAQNAQNRLKKPGAVSRFMGVYQSKDAWIANYGGLYLGRFLKEEVAAYAYNEHVKTLFDKPKLNDVPFPEEYHPYEHSSEKIQVSLTRSIGKAKLSKCMGYFKLKIGKHNTPCALFI
jgi:hypothetical protein